MVYLSIICAIRVKKPSWCKKTVGSTVSTPIQLGEKSLLSQKKYLRGFLLNNSLHGPDGCKKRPHGSQAPG
jgi:hypothetical protein